MAPELAVADGGLVFWKALGEVWPTTREQRCWAHKTANVLNKLPKSQQPKAKRAVKPINSFLPSGVPPIITRMHCFSSSSRACRWMPSAQM